MTTALILILTLAGLFMTYRCYKLEKENKKLKDGCNKHKLILSGEEISGVINKHYDELKD